MKVLVTSPEYFPKGFIKMLEKIGRVVTKKTSYEELLEEIKDIDVLIIRVETKIDKKILDQAEKLRIIVTMTTGLDHIDVRQAELHGIKVVSTPGYATGATAEYTMSLILSMIKKIPWAFEHFKKEKWERHRFLGSELGGKTIGVVGFGRIGSRVGRYAKTFGMDVIFFDPYLDEKMLQGIEAKRVFTIDELLEQSDVVTIHTFLSKETEKMMNKEKFSRMKKNAILINASRGAVVDESDLVEALENGTIAGAALDVFEKEPLPPSHELVNYARSHENLLLTPHLAGSTKESIEEAAKQATEVILQEIGVRKNDKD